jgi:capsular polysaccharide transport system permease protein
MTRSAGVALVQQADIVGALVVRETHVRFGRTRLGYLWVLIEPLAHAAALSLVYYTLGRRSPVGGGMTLFFLTGLLPFFLWNKVSNRLVSSFTTDRPLLGIPAVTPLDILLARALLEGAAWLVVVTVLFSFLVALEICPPPNDFQALAAVVIVTFLLGFGIGAINATLTALLRSWQNIFFIITRPLYLGSGVFYLVDQLPVTAQRILVWNPLVHAVEWFRTAYYASYTTMTLDKSYLVTWAVAAVVIGLGAERLGRRRVSST